MISPIMRKQLKVSQIYWNKLVIKWVDMYAKFWFKWHEWTDFATPIWTELFAWVEWQVTVKNDGKVGYWLSVTIEKSRVDWSSCILYAHLSETPLKSWMVVKVWDFIGKSWNSWNSTAPHLHFGVRMKDKTGKVVDYFNWEHWRKNAMDYFEKWKYRM